MTDRKMFCFQCEQTAGCSGCTGKAGVCGKTADTARVQDELTGALIGLAAALEKREGSMTQQAHLLTVKSLFATLTNVNFDNASLRELTDQVHRLT